MPASLAFKLTVPAVEPCPVETIEGALESGILILCDHASNAVPPDLGDLGLPEAEFERHIAYDIGAAAVTRSLARRLGAPAVLTRFSRLIIDPNRGRDDPTLVMRLSDGAVVPGNAHVDDAEIASRIERFYDPYDAASRLGSVMP
jgi:predicted N-formylglutamate amidohydrolase